MCDRVWKSRWRNCQLFAMYVVRFPFIWAWPNQPSFDVWKLKPHQQPQVNQRMHHIHHRQLQLHLQPPGPHRNIEVHHRRPPPRNGGGGHAAPLRNYCAAVRKLNSVNLLFCSFPGSRRTRQDHRGPSLRPEQSLLI